MRLSKIAVCLSMFLSLIFPLHSMAQTSEANPERQVIPNPNGTSSQPPGYIKEKFGEWHLVCDQPAGAPGDQCVLMQNVVADDRADVGLSVIVIKTADKKARILRILAPLGVLLPNGLGLIIDGKDLGRAYFTRCFTDGCFVQVIMDDDMLNALKSGDTAIFFIFQSEEEGIGLPVDLTGFSKGFEALE
ncbi:MULTISPECIES: invasion associated locus B family protein [unclassified Lentilitoribacter]|jgi:invasion protein IalB|uniref:invasion associated locus B family protein n=1 Tax=unclassified Lentilitoribacter TaxID=2647570 RepID=UPI001FCE8A8B|nr:invasion associated locus B family protein [Lentilitoribacter sp. Alg239-R112]